MVRDSVELMVARLTIAVKVMPWADVPSTSSCLRLPSFNQARSQTITQPYSSGMNIL